MGRRVATGIWASEGTGIAIAIVHLGAVLAPHVKIHRISIESRLDVELRVEYRRYAGKATGGTAANDAPLTDGGTGTAVDVRTGAINNLGLPEMVLPDRLATRGPPVGGHVFASGAFTLAPNNTFAIVLLDEVPRSVSAPITFVVEYE